MIREMESRVDERGGTTPAVGGSVWVKGPITPASTVLQKALRRQAPCHRGETPPPGDAPLAVVVCGNETAPEKITSEVRAALQAAPGAAVVVLKPYPDAEMARAAVRAGARGFLHAGMPPEQAARAVWVAIGGQMVLPRELLEGLVAAERPAGLSALGSRQREVVELVTEGLSNAEIARTLHLSESTVKQHLRSAYKVLGVKNRREAAAALRRAGYCSPMSGQDAAPPSREAEEVRRP